MISVATIVVHRNNRELVDTQIQQIWDMSRQLPDVSNHIIVVSAGSLPEYESQYKTIWYPDDPFRGKCFAHNVGLKSLDLNNYDYVWFNHPDLYFTDPRCLETLIMTMELNPSIGMISPRHSTSFPAKLLKDNPHDFHLVASVDYLSLLIRKECLKTLGFLNEIFHYCWGAGEEYAYKLYRAGWRVAYSDGAKCVHFGGTTYGKVPNTPIREEYITRARSFCRTYFPAKYGANWFIDFYEVLPLIVKRLRYDGTEWASLAKGPSSFLEDNPFWIKRQNWEIR